MKTCSKCKITKELNLFGKDKHNPDGYKYMCKECEKTKYTKICECCGKEFKTGTKSQFCCSKQCSGMMQRVPRIHCNCDICNKPLELTEKEYNRGIHHYCSIECMGKGESKFHTGENAKNWSGGNVEYNCDICGKLCYINKHEYSKYKYHYCSKECKHTGQTVFYSGENAKKYDATISPEERDRQRYIPGYRMFIRSILVRDKFTCKCCGAYSVELHVHHLDGFKENPNKRMDEDNTIALCAECHYEFHGIYGRGNNTKLQYEEFIKNKYTDVI